MKAMAANFAKQHGISCDWCFAHMVCKACDHTFGTAALKITAAREVIQKLIKVVENIIPKSPLQKAMFEDNIHKMQLEIKE